MQKKRPNKYGKIFFNLNNKKKNLNEMKLLKRNQREHPTHNSFQLPARFCISIFSSQANFVHLRKNRVNSCCEAQNYKREIVMEANCK